jgi:ATP-dependent Clp protease ATP-binding subunit ClpB
MTSNVGSQRLLGDPPDTEGVMDDLRRTFRPEFLNRVDDIVLFERLARADLDRIVELQIDRFRKLLRERDIGIALAPAAVSFLADKGFDPVYGARPLKRAITNYLQNPLARRLIAGEFVPGETVWVTRKGDELAFSLKPPAASSAVS